MLTMLLRHNNALRYSAKWYAGIVSDILVSTPPSNAFS